MTVTTTRLRAINPVQLGLILGIIYAVIALVVGAVFLIMGAFTFPLTQSTFLAMRPSPLVIIVFPIAYFVVGFLIGLIAAALFNLISGWIGGLELTFEQTV